MDNTLKKKEFAEYLKLAEDIDNRLEGTSHIISRRKLRGYNGYYQNELNNIHFFQTFHSLAAKILPKYSSDPVASNLKKGSLSGDNMYSRIDKAVGVYSAVMGLTDIEVKPYYISIRLYENGHVDTLANLRGGYEIYDIYQISMENKLDWEESIQLATYFLKKDIINSLEDLPDRYIVVDANGLLADGNGNIARFYVEFYNWCIRNRKNVNFHLLKNDKKLIPFVNGIRYNEIDVKELLNN